MFSNFGDLDALTEAEWDKVGKPEFRGISLIDVSVLGYLSDSLANFERQSRGWCLFADFVRGWRRGRREQHGVFRHQSRRSGLY